MSRLSPDGTNQDWEKLLYIHTLKLSNAKTMEERRQAERELKAIQRSATLVKKGRPPSRVDFGPSLREELIADLKSDDDGLRPDQRYTEDELRERFGIDLACPKCDAEVWDVGDGPHCCCDGGVPTRVTFPALPSGNPDEPF